MVTKPPQRSTGDPYAMRPLLPPCRHGTWDPTRPHSRCVPPLSSERGRSEERRSGEQEVVACGSASVRVRMSTGQPYAVSLVRRVDPGGCGNGRSGQSGGPGAMATTFSATAASRGTTQTNDPDKMNEGNKTECDDKENQSPPEPRPKTAEKKRAGETKQNKDTPPVARDSKPAARDARESAVTTAREGREARVRLPAHMEPTFYIGGGNGVALVEEVCLGLGWKRSMDKRDENFRFKWVEIKGQINYYSFREGEQMVNHIPNCNLLTNKLGLLNSLSEYDRMCQAVKKRALKLDFLPETFRLDDPRDRNTFLNTYTEGEQWICKPTGKNQGKGIFIIKSQGEVNKIFEEQDERSESGKPMKPLNRIIQRYLNKPLLLNRKKFDIRCYMLIANTVPYLVLYHRGYVRLTIHDYDTNTENLIAHLTNQFIQKKDPSYKDVKEETTWSMERFNDYLNDHYLDEKGIDKDWALTVLPARIKQIMTYCFQCVKSRLQCKIGYHDLYGFDFMIDEDMKVWLIEVNVNPCIATNCEALREVVPLVVRDTIHIANECFEKSRKGRALLPLASQGDFEILYSHGTKTPRKPVTSSPYRKDVGSRMRTTPASPVRRSQTAISPVKELSVVAPSLDANVQQTGKTGTGNLQYTLNKQGMTGGKVGPAPRVRNTPTATPTIINPGSGLPVPQRSHSFAHPRQGAPPSNSVKAAQGNVSKPQPASTHASVAAKPAQPPSKPPAPSASKSGPAVSKSGSTPTTAKSADTQKQAPPKSARPARSMSESPNQGLTPVRNGNGKDSKSNATNTKSSLKTVKETGEPPHHQKIKKDLKNKVTATETIVIRNITKQNQARKQNQAPDAVSVARSTKSSKSSIASTSGKERNSKIPSPSPQTNKKEASRPRRHVVRKARDGDIDSDDACNDLDSASDMSDDVTRAMRQASGHDHSAQSHAQITSRRRSKGQNGPSESHDVTSESQRHEKNSNQSNNHESGLNISSALENKQDINPTDTSQSHAASVPSQSPAVTSHSPVVTSQSLVSPRRISLHMSPHGWRGSRDGGKPETSMRFAAMYPTSPYVDPQPAVRPGAVPQLRMTHNGVIPKVKRVNSVKGEQPNRGS